MNINTLKVSTLEILSAINDPKNQHTLKCSDIHSEPNTLESGDAGRLLSYITTMMFDPSEKRMPFKPFFKFGESRSPTTTDINKKNLFCISAMTGNIENHELRARFSDLIWCTIPGLLTQAYIAIDAYVAAAKQLILSNESFEAMHRLERALRIGYPLQKSPNNNYKFATNYILELLAQENLAEYPDQILKLACEFRIQEDSTLYTLAESIAEHHLRRRDFRRAVTLFEIALTCAISMKNKDKEFASLRKIVTCHEAEADCSNSAISTGCLMAAIEAIRKTPNSKPKQIELYAKLRENQRELKHNMETYSISSGDMSKEVKRAETIVIGQDCYDSIFRLALVVSVPTPISRLRSVVEGSIGNSILADLGAEHIDSEGITIATTPGFGVKKENDIIAIEHHLMRLLKHDHVMLAKAQILPATEAIANTYYFDKSIWEPFLTNNPFIPSGHREYYARGLIAGFDGDFLTSSHLLIPQIENSLRYVLDGLNEEVTRIHGNGDQERDGLKVLLEHPKLNTEFGDILYHLKAILIDKVYGDLRNQVSHGYIDSNQINSEASVTLWWLVLRIVILPYREYWFAKYGEAFISEKKHNKTRA